MATHRRYLIRGAFITVIFSVAGCVSGGGVVPKADNQLMLPSAPQPLRLAGDRTYYSSGRREQVQTLKGGVATIRRSSSLSYGMSRDQLFLEAFRNSSNRLSKTRILESNGTLWPLQVGNEMDLLVEKSVRDRATGVTADPRQQFWSCRVDSAEQTSVIAGTFATFRINCVRSTERRNFRQRSYFYYSPKLGQTVLRLDHFRFRKPRRLELSAFEPALTMLPRKSKQRFQANFQRVLENLPSGKPSAWRSRAPGTTITVTPVKTFKGDHGQYCRNYRMQIQSPRLKRSGAGLVCRNGNGEWNIPRKVAGQEKEDKGGRRS